MIGVMLGLLGVALALVYYYFTAHFSHWKNKGVPCMKTYPLFGSMPSVLLFREHISNFFQRLYLEMYDLPFGGFFQGRTPTLFVKDPELIKHILIKDFQHFVDHGIEVDEDLNPLQGKNLFNLRGQKWKAMRSKLTPTFTSGRMKSMFPLVLECANSFDKYLNNLATQNSEMDVKDILARYTTDIISSCAFGVQTDSLNNPNNEFRQMGVKILTLNLSLAIRRATILFAPEVAKFFRFQFTDDATNQFFRRMVSGVIEERTKMGKSRKDFMQLLIELKEKGKIADEDPTDKDEYENEHLEHNLAPQKWTDDDITAQAVVFFIAGFETSSSAMTFALFELARRPELQLKARRHIEEVLQRHGGQITYQALQEMTYLDCILQESLRKYPPLAMLNRKCTKNYVIPNSEVVIEQGTPIIIPVHALHYDHRYFPEPERFNPDRFSDENSLRERNQFVYMPFGEGPRQCIGMRFAKIQSKLGLLSVLRNYEISSSPKTKYPLTFDNYNFLLTSKEKVFVRIAHKKD